MKVVSYAKLKLSIDVKATQDELLAAGGQWRPHLNTYHYTGAWTVLPLRSPGGNHRNPVPELMGEAGFNDTIYMDDFPSVKTALDNLQCPLMSVRFLNLQAGAIIKEHNDAQLAFEKGEARLHFPIITNPMVEFYSENERLFLGEGECWYLNANLPHRVGNYGNNDRIHLIVDCQVNDWLKNLILSAEIIDRRQEPVDENMLAAIKDYRAENTEASNKQADMLQGIVDQLMADE